MLKPGSKLLFAALFFIFFPTITAQADRSILNASYEPTRRFYSAVNKAFAAHWQAEQGERVRIYQSHAGSGAPGRAVRFRPGGGGGTPPPASDHEAISEGAGPL